MPRRSDVSTFSSSLFAFKPRQVLLLEHQQRRVAVSPPMAIAKSGLKPEDESVLISTVAMWLEKKGFSNVLKRFLSAAGIEDDTWKAKALNLNEVFSKYQELCNSAWEQRTSQKKLEEQVDVTKETNGDTNVTFSEEAGSKKKKKKGKQDATVSVTRQTSDGPIINEDINESKSKSSMESNGEEAFESKEDLSTKNQKHKKKKKSKSSSEALDADEKQIEVMPEVTESKNQDLEAFESKEDPSTKKRKDKKKKKSKSSSGALDADEKQIEVIPEAIESKNQDLEAFESKEDLSTKKEKDKKNKKSKSSSEALDTDEKQIEVMPEVIESKNQGLSSQSSADEALNKKPTADKNSKRNKVKAAENVVNESEKTSKKRKRMDPDETKNQSGGEVVEESKLKKSKGLEDNYVDPGANGHESKKKNCMDGHVGSTNLSSKQTDGSIINSNGVDKSTQQKSAKKERNSSAEPKTVNAFQRVKIDEVEFVDERLQDNSYWAKDGADTGYGAKAQEVLGQVKGRDFRHEKTKKKRGSYRGGQIDLQSHSIKFNYSEDE